MISLTTADALAKHRNAIAHLEGFKRDLRYCSSPGELAFYRLADYRQSVPLCHEVMVAAIEGALNKSCELMAEAESAARTELGVERVGQMEAALNSAIRECEHWATHHIEKGSVEKHNYWQEKASEYREAIRHTDPEPEA